MRLVPSTITSYRPTAGQSPLHQDGSQCRFGHKTEHVHDEFCSHHHHDSHSQEMPSPKASGNIIRQVGQWLNRLWTGLIQDLQAFARFFKRSLGFKAADAPAPAEHKHSEHCNHSH